jgi:phage shock protein B
MDDIFLALIIIPTIFVGMPWVILHYITRWKTASTLTSGDEALLDELYQVAKRLDSRMDTVERLVAADNPDFRPARIVHDRETDNHQLRELGDKLGKSERTAR